MFRARNPASALEKKFDARYDWTTIERLRIEEISAWRKFCVTPRSRPLDVSLCQEPTKGGFNKGSFRRIWCHAQEDTSFQGYAPGTQRATAKKEVGAIFWAIPSKSIPLLVPHYAHRCLETEGLLYGGAFALSYLRSKMVEFHSLGRPRNSACKKGVLRSLRSLFYVPVKRLWC